jgi:hypothetical protein
VRGGAIADLRNAASARPRRGKTAVPTGTAGAEWNRQDGGRTIEYWRGQCRATFQCDRIDARLVEEIGVETLMWGSHYPHPDGVRPEACKYKSSKYIAEELIGLPPETVHKITCENAGKFCGLIA